MSSPRLSWKPLLAATGGLFLIILAFLAGQVKAGGDPAIGRGTAATQQDQPPQQTAPPGFGSGEDPSDDDDDGDDELEARLKALLGVAGREVLDGFIPGGSQPTPPVPGSRSESSADAPATHQS